MKNRKFETLENSNFDKETQRKGKKERKNSSSSRKKENFENFSSIQKKYSELNFFFAKKKYVKSEKKYILYIKL